MQSKAWSEITYQFQKIKGAIVEVCEWINKFDPHFKMDTIAYSYRD